MNLTLDAAGVSALANTIGGDIGIFDGDSTLVVWPHREAEVLAALADPDWREKAPTAPVPDAAPLQLYDELDQMHGIDLEAEIGGLSQKALRRFRLSNSISRTDPFASALQAKLGWSDAELDALFRAAAARQP
jgi:hypothetical protein